MIKLKWYWFLILVVGLGIVIAWLVIYGMVFLASLT